MNEINTIKEELGRVLDGIMEKQNLNSITSAWNLLLHVWEENKDSDPFKHIPWVYLNDDVIKVYANDDEMNEDEEYIRVLLCDEEETNENETEA